MDLYTAECQRTVRTYEWAKARCEEEIQGCYATLDALGCAGEGFFPKYLATLSAEEGQRLARAFVIVKHPIGVRLSGDPPTSNEDERMFDAYAAAHRGPYQEYLLGQFRRFREEPQMSVRRLSATLIEQLTFITGAPFKRDPDWQNASRCVVRLGDWMIETGFRIVPKTGATYTELHQHVCRLDMPKRVNLGEFGCAALPLYRMSSHGFTSYPACLGFRASWHVPCAEDELPTARAMARSAEILLQALPDILHGLNIDD